MILRSNKKKASLKARLIPLPLAIAGSETPQCAVIGCPNGADLLRRVVTDCEYEIKSGRIRNRELVPAFTSQALCRNVRFFQLFQSFWPYVSRWRIASAMIERAEFPVQRNRTL